MSHVPGHPAPNPTQPGSGGGGGGSGGGRGFRNFGGFRFGQRFHGIGADDLTRLTGILGGVPDLFDLTGQKGNNLFRNGTIRAPGLRKLLGAGSLGSGDTDFINSLLGNLGPGPGFTGVDSSGQFILGQGLAGLLSERELARLQSILSQRPNKTANAFKGGRVNFPDLRRLFNELNEGTPAKDFIKEILVRGRTQGVDDHPSNNNGGDGGAPPPGTTAEGGTGSGGGGGGNTSIPPGLGSALEKLLGELAGGQGIPPEILREQRNRVIGGSKGALRDNLLRAEERLAARGLSDSGLGERAFEDIEDFNLNARNASLGNLDAQDAAIAQQNQLASINGILGLGGLNLDEFLGREGIRLGERGLDLRELEVLINAALQELFANLGLGGFLGFGGEGGGVDFSNLFPSSGGAGGVDRNSDPFAR